MSYLSLRDSYPLKIIASHDYEGHARSDAWITIAKEALKDPPVKSDTTIGE